MTINASERYDDNLLFGTVHAHERGHSCRRSSDDDFQRCFYCCSQATHALLLGRLYVRTMSSHEAARARSHFEKLQREFVDTEHDKPIKIGSVAGRKMLEVGHPEVRSHFRFCWCMLEAATAAAAAAARCYSAALAH